MFSVCNTAAWAHLHIKPELLSELLWNATILASIASEEEKKPQNFL